MPAGNYNKSRGDPERFLAPAIPSPGGANFEYEQNNSQGRGTRKAASRSVLLLAKFAGWGPSLSRVGC